MKKLNLSLLFACVIPLFSLAQVTFESNHYPQAGDEFPMISYVKNPGGDTVFVSDFGTEQIQFHTIDMFDDYLVDTVIYKLPGEFDPDGNFPTATHMLQDENQNIFIEHSTEAAVALGFSGDMFDMGMNIPITGDTPLKMMEFPTNTQTSFTSSTTGDYTMPTQALQNIVPAEYYDQFAENFDSVRIVIEIEEIHDVLSEQNVDIDLGSVNNGNHDCLKEFVESYSMVNIHVRSSSFGIWAPLSDIPGVGDALPVELPRMDTTFFLKWWTPEFKLPLVEAECDVEHQIITNLKFHYNGENSVAMQNLLSVTLYPNPAENQVKVTDLPKESAEIILINATGKQKKNFVVSGDQFMFDCNQLASGWYMVQVLDKAGKPIAQQRLIIK